MAPKARRPAAHLIEDLYRDPRGYSFFEAVRILRTARAQLLSDFLVEAKGPPVWLKVDDSLTFPASDVVVLRPETWGASTLVVSFLGLHGSASPMPVSFLEAGKMIASDPEDNPRRDFLDFFHNRILEQYHAAWEKYRLHLRHDSKGEGGITEQLFALIGLGAAELRRQAAFDYGRLLSYVGLIAMRSRSAGILAGVVAHGFRLARVEVDQCQPRRVAVDPRQRARLGEANAALGVDCHIGESAMDIAGKFTLRIGPIAFDRLLDFMPDHIAYESVGGRAIGREHGALRDVVSFMLRDRMAFDAEVLVHRDDDPETRRGGIPLARLGGDAPVYLGLSAWLGQPAEDPLPVRLRLAG